QEKLDDLCAIAVEMCLKLPYAFVSVCPEPCVNIFDTAVTRYPFRQVVFRVNLTYQHIFIMRAIMDADSTPFGKRFIVPPKKIMLIIITGRLLKTKHLTALWVDTAHHVLDRSIFSRCIHCLKDDQQTLRIFSVEPLLKFPELGLEISQIVFGGFFFQRPCIIGWIVLQTEGFT